MRLVNKFAHFLEQRATSINVRRLWQNYVLGLALILFFVIASHIASLHALLDSDEHADLVSDSVGQRARVDNILSLSEMALALRTPITAERLKQEVAKFERMHHELLERCDLFGKISMVYFKGGKGPALDPMVRKFAADARLIGSIHSTKPVAARALRRMRSVQESMRRSLMEVTEDLQLGIKQHSSDLRDLQNIAFAFAVIMLLCEAAFIFFPAHVAVRVAIDRLKAQTNNLRKAQADVEARNHELEDLRRSAEHEATHDALTGLANRRAFQQEADRIAKSSAENKTGIALLHIDLDRFKEINDTLGHPAGDFILKHVAKTLRDCTNGQDIVARIGGDEFVIMKEFSGDRRMLEILASRLIEKLCRPVEYEGCRCHFGASIGIEIANPKKVGPHFRTDLMMANADIALYHAKESGRGRFAFFCDTLREETETTRALSDEMSLAINRGEFFPVYQPIIDAVSGEICGVEALARWRHPTRGEILPGQFLPIAQRMDCVATIDRLIFEQALADFAQWRSRGAYVPRLSLNLSSARLRDRNLINSLTKADIPPGAISFELLETAFSNQADDELKYALDAFTEAGVQIEIDDFGAGQTSLVSLLALKPQRLKISRTLVAALPNSKRHLSLVQSITNIAASLDIRVTATGIETETQKKVLSDLGCDQLQGFLFSRAASADMLETMLSGRLRPAARRLPDFTEVASA